MKEETLEKIHSMHKKYKEARREMAKAIIGLEEEVDLIFTAIFAGGHVVIDGSPGRAKTRIVRTIGEISDMRFVKLQVPGDQSSDTIKGYEVVVPTINLGGSDSEEALKKSITEELKTLIREGPLVDAQLVLFDEISRTSDIVQAALFSALEEGEFSVGNKMYRMDELFTVIATRNIYDTRGVRPLSFAFADRFCLSAKITRPDFEDECKIIAMSRDKNFKGLGLQKVLKKTDVAEMRKIIQTERFFESNHPIVEYISRLIRNTDPYNISESMAREIQEKEKEFDGLKLELEASPRAGQWFAQIIGMYVHCILGEKIVLPEHVQYLAKPILRHRLTFRSKLEHQSINYAELFIEAIIKRTSVYE